MRTITFFQTACLLKGQRKCFHTWQSSGLYDQAAMLRRKCLLCGCLQATLRVIPMVQWGSGTWDWPQELPQERRKSKHCQTGNFLSHLQVIFPRVTGPEHRSFLKATYASYANNSFIAYFRFKWVKFVDLKISWVLSLKTQIIWLKQMSSWFRWQETILYHTRQKHNTGVLP